MPRKTPKVVDASPDDPKKRVAGRRRITKHDANRIVEIVRHWPSSPLTWDLIVDKVERDLAMAGPESKRSGLGGWTRQGLSRREEIKKAYQDRRAQLAEEDVRVRKNPARNRDPEMVVLRRERDALAIENDGLRAKIAAYEQRIALLTHNAAYNKPAERLEEPLKKKINRRGQE